MHKKNQPKKSEPTNRLAELGRRTALHVKNFKGFENLSIENLSLINLISGRNDVGKTSILEAIFIHAGVDNAGLPLNVCAIRGIQQFEVDPSTLANLFFEYRTDEEISIKTVDAEGRWADSTLRLEAIDIAVIQDATKPSTSSDSDADSKGSLVLSYHDSAGAELSAKMSASTQKGFLVEPSKIPSTAAQQRAILVGSKGANASEDAMRFTKLAEKKKLAELIPMLKIVEPRLQSLQILVVGGSPVVHADIGLSTLLPIPYCGEGLQRMLSICLAIASASRGFVLIDEIENGFHHSVMGDVWRSIRASARNYNTQIFATTHSWECICTAHKVFKEDADYDLSLQRLERRSGDQVVALHYDKELLDSAIEQDIEVR